MTRIHNTDKDNGFPSITLIVWKACNEKSLIAGLMANFDYGDDGEPSSSNNRTGARTEQTPAQRKPAK